MYNLEKDIEEQIDVSATFPEIATRLSDQLTAEFKDLPVLYPTPDSLYSEDSFQLKYQYYKKTLLPRLEKQRKDFLTEGWSPNSDWWGSKVTID